MTDEQIVELNEILDKISNVVDRMCERAGITVTEEEVDEWLKERENKKNNTLVCEVKKCRHCVVSVFDERGITCMHCMKEFPFKLCKYYEVN